MISSKRYRVPRIDFNFLQKVLKGKCRNILDWRIVVSHIVNNMEQVVYIIHSEQRMNFCTGILYIELETTTSIIEIQITVIVIFNREDINSYAQ